MGGLLALPLKITSLLREKGFFYLFRFSLSYIYLTICKKTEKKRFGVYQHNALGEPEKNAFYIPKHEWRLDTPRKSINLKKFSDDAFIFGTNSKSEYLAVHVSRLPEDYVRCSLVLRLSNGLSYSLPKEHAIQRATSEDYTFGSSRLKLRCLLPMRRWRMYFNGVLEESSHDGQSTSTTYKHVKMTFLWVASSEVFDFSCDMSKTVVSHAAASSLSWSFSPMSLLKKIHSIFDRYYQPGMLYGTFQIENAPEQQMYIWGARERSMGTVDRLQNSKYMETFGHFKDGTSMHVGLLSTPGVIKAFVYGYVMKSCGFIYPIKKFDYKNSSSSGEEMIIQCTAGGENYNIKIESIEAKGFRFQKELDDLSSIKTANMVLNNKKGNGFVFKGVVTKSERSSPKKERVASIRSSTPLKSQSVLTLQFKDELCQFSELCGGKGSSLGKLYSLANASSTEHSEKFAVPNGTVVTTIAYKEFTKLNLEPTLKQFEKEVWSTKPHQDIIHLCKKIIEQVAETKLPENVESSIARDLRAIFGDSYSERKFAVRSSATGEDTEQMSAAGQMETFLGVKGIEEISKAVSKCWASQFTFQAVEYKRRYGQRLNTPMAVVIQEMVACDVAGVMFTCDPVSGDPSYINITANYGLGESVVSASAEPDTVILKRDIDNTLTFHSKKLGKKTTKIIMDGSEGTKEVEIDNEASAQCCIDENESIDLGKIALKIEEEYGSSRDLEWGILNGKVFLFQSRPVTSLDVETEFEVLHYIDSAIRCEDEIISRAHVGEAMVGACSVLGGDMMNKTMMVANAKLFLKFDAEDVPQVPYFSRGATIAYYQVFFNLISGMFKFNNETDFFSNAFIVAFFGRLFDDKEIREMAKERHPPHAAGLTKAFIAPIYLGVMSFVAGIYSRRVARQLKNFTIPLESEPSSSEMLDKIARLYDSPLQASCAHMNCTFSSTFWNASILALLAKAEGEWNNVVYSDFAYLLSTCSNVESADVPSAIEELALVISKSTDPTAFKKMDPEEALKWLQTNTSEPGIKFKQFLERHGHRCLKEFDIFQKVWGTHPTSLVKTLQNLVRKDFKKSAQKKVDSFPVILSKLKVKLSFLEKIKLFCLLPNTQRAVGEREYSKGFLIKIMNCYRIAFDRLAKQLVREGYLTREEHVFFLHVEEIRELCKSRSPKIVSSAARRWKVFDKVNKMMFSEFVTGIPKPINDNETIPTGKGFKMTGVPVSRGVVKATARVIKSISEASSIQPGDILITYSTDIAWSPYFPLLVGVVTELGGLISHGAVVAREYGLPCVVALHGATRAFKSGDVVILDGNKGTLQRVDDD